MFERLTLLARSNPLRLLCLMWFGLVWALSPVQAQQPEVVNWDALTISASDAETTQSLIPRLQDRYDPDLLKEFDLSVWEDLPLAEPLLGREVANDGYVLPLVSDGARVTGKLPDGLTQASMADALGMALEADDALVTGATGEARAAPALETLGTLGRWMTITESMTATFTEADMSVALTTAPDADAAPIKAAL